MERMETDKLRPLLYSLGVLLLSLGGSPVINYFSGESSIKSVIPGALLCILGMATLGFGYWWHPNPESKFAQRLVSLASNPTIYLAMVLMVWIYMETLALARNNEIIALRNDEHSIAEVLNRFVLPRQLTPDQVQAISSFLQNFPAQNYSFEVVEGDAEASQYASALQAALNKGGWHLKTIQQVQAPPNDLQITLNKAMDNSQGKRDDKFPTPETVLQMAFGLAGVQASGWGSRSNDPKVTEDVFTISVGHRRRDAYASPCVPK